MSNDLKQWDPYRYPHDSWEWEKQQKLPGTVHKANPSNTNNPYPEHLKGRMKTDCVASSGSAKSL